MASGYEGFQEAELQANVDRLVDVIDRVVGAGAGRCTLRPSGAYGADPVASSLRSIAPEV